MPGKDATKVRVALTGSVFAANEGTTLPTDITQTVAAASASWVDLGYTTEDGVTFSVEQTTEDIPGWQSLEPLRSIVTAEPKGFSFTLRQMERNTFTTAFGGAVTGSTGNWIWTPPASGSIPIKAYIIEFVDESLTYRFIYRRNQQQGARELNFVRSNAVNLPLDYKVLAASPGAWLLQTNDNAFAP